MFCSATRNNAWLKNSTGNFSPGSGDQIIGPEDFEDEEDNPKILSDDDEDED